MNFSRRITSMPSRFGASISVPSNDGYMRVIRKRIAVRVYTSKSQKQRLVKPVKEVNIPEPIRKPFTTIGWQRLPRVSPGKPAYKMCLPKIVHQEYCSESMTFASKKIINFRRVTSCKSRAVGMLDNHRLFGPLTRFEHYRRLNALHEKRAQEVIPIASRMVQDIVGVDESARDNSVYSGKCQATSVKQVKKRHGFIRESIKFFTRGEIKRAVRSPILARLLRSRIREMVFKRSSSHVRSNMLSICNKYAREQRLLKSWRMSPVGRKPCSWFSQVNLNPQMDVAADDLVIDSLATKDVTIIDQRISSTEQGPVFTDRSWTRLTTTEPYKEDEALLSRNTLVRVDKWDTTMVASTNIYDMNAPIDLLHLMPNTPVSLLFKQHTYWRGDMEVTLLLNSNPLMTGAVQLCWYYCADMDPSYKVKKTSIHSSSQMLHTIAQAGSSNPMILQIPYAYMYPYVPVLQRPNDCCRLMLGGLRLQVLNRLQATSTTDNVCSISTFVRFKNNQFMGMVDATLAFSQMECALANLAISAAESYLVNSFADSNRDNPPVVNNPTSVQIVQGGNMANGTNVPEVTGNLRLNPAGQTPYLGLNREEMSVRDFSSVFGLLHSARWSMQDAFGTVIGRWSAGPIGDLQAYPTVLVDQKSYFVLPPVAYISNLFKQTRGTIEYRFDFICNAMYTGSVLVAFVPSQADITLSQARSSAHTIFSLHEGKSFTFVTPYIADRVWWPRAFSGGDSKYDFKTPGKVHMFVLNPLSLNSIIPDTIDINVYVRGGEDFEVSVPVQPSISSYQFPSYTQTTPSDLKALEGYYPYYVGTSRYFYDNKYALLRYGSVDDHLTYFDIPKKVSGYFVYSGNDATLLRYKSGETWIASTNYAKFGVLIKDPGNEHYWLALVKNESDAQGFAVKAEEKYLYAYINDDADTYYGQANSAWTYKAWPVTVTLESQGQREEGGLVVDAKGSLPSTNSGFVTFGEDFSSLTNLLRRYQYMDTITIRGGDIAAGGILDIPVKMNGMFTFKTNAASMVMRGREGNLSLIAACYRYFRGGMRYLFATSCSSQYPMTMYIQHKVDVQAYDNSSSVSSENFLGQGYSMYVQNLTTNPVVKVEVPYYLDSTYGFLGDPSGSSYSDKYRTCNLGRLFIGIDSMAQINCRMRIFTSLADDAKFEIFQGTPPVKFIREELFVDDRESFDIIDPQMDVDAPAVVSLAGVAGPSGVRTAQGGVSSRATRTLDNTDQAMTSIASVSHRLDGFMTKAAETWDRVSTGSTGFSEMITKERFFFVFNQFVHMLISPNWQTIAWGVASMLVSLVQAGSEYITNVFSSISDTIKAWWENEQTNSTPLQPQGDFPGASQVVTCLGSLVIAVLGVKFSYPGEYMNNMRKLFFNFNIFGRGLTGLMSIISNIFGCTYELMRYYLMHRNGVADVNVLLKNHGRELQVWAAKCEKILDPKTLSERMLDDLLADIVTSLHLDACIYTAQLAACAGQNSAMIYIRSLSDRLRDLRDKLYQMGKHPYTRMTPYSIWVEGQPGIGKSTLVTDLVSSILRSKNLNGPGQMMFKYEPMNDHWDNCAKPKCVVIDDAFITKTSNALEKQIGTYFGLVTNAPFTPPMAHLENKHTRIQPHLVVTCANMAYPKDASISTPEALYRRRHILVKATIVETYKANARFWYGGNVHPEVLTEEERRSFAWLQFEIYQTPHTESGDVYTPMGYAAFRDFVCAKFSAFYDSEKISMDHRIQDMVNCAIVDVTPTTVPAEAKKKYYQRALAFMKGKWDDIERFVIANNDGFTRANPNSAFRDYVLPQQPTIVATPEIDLSAEDLADVNTFISNSLREELNILPAHLTMGGEAHFGNRNLSREMLEHIRVKGGYTGVDTIEINYPPPTQGIDLERVVPEQLLENMIKIIKSEPILDSEKRRVEEFIKKWGARAREIRAKACAHVVCECFNLITVTEGEPNSNTFKSHEFIVPRCDDCFARKVMPVMFTPCSRTCRLYDYASINAKWLGSEIARVSLKTYELVTSVSIKLFTGGLAYAKAALTKAVDGVYWVLKKTIKTFVFVIMPLFGAYFVCSKAFSPEYSQQVATKIGTVGGYVTGKALAGYGKLVELFDKDGKSVIVPQASIYEGADSTRGSGRLPARNIVIKKLNPNSSEDMMSVSGSEYLKDVTRIVMRNSYTLVVEFKGDDGKLRKNTTRGIFIRNRQMLLVTHCWDELIFRVKNKQGKMYLVQEPSFCLELDVAKLENMKFAESNFSIVQFPVIIPEHKNIIKHIPSLRDHRLITNNAMLVTNDQQVTQRVLKIEYVKEHQLVRGTANSGPVTMAGSYRYNFGGAGLCGSVLLCTDTNPCLIGIHVAGIGTYTGYSEPLVKEMFEDVPSYADDIQDVVLPPLDDLEKSGHQIDGNFIQLGVVEAQYAHTESGETSIVPSLAHGVFPVTTAPAPLAKGDERLPPGSSPMLLGVAKLGEPIKGFPSTHLKFADDFISAEINTKVLPIIGVEPLTLQEAVCGRPGVAGFSSLNFNSSEGFPLSSKRPLGAVGKKWLFDLELIQDHIVLRGIHKDLKTIMAIKQRLREKNILPFTVFVDCLKDARMSIPKCSMPGKTRIFSISPVDYSIQFRQYFLPYTVAHQNSRRSFSSSVGINVNGWEWSDLVLRMNDFSPYHACGDYSNFGSAFSMELHEIATRAVCNWFRFNGDGDHRNHRIRSVLVKELLSSVHLCFNILYRTVCGMPSGSPITVETNDLVNLGYIAMAWYDIMMDSDLSSHYHFNKYVRIKTYGDDLWLSISPIVVDRFNNVSIQQFFARYSVKYTDADKSGTMIPFKSIDDVSFLKRVPRPHPIRKFCFLAELERAPALDIANWCWKSKDIKASTLVNLEACSDACFGFGPTEHENVRRVVMDIAHRLGYVGNFRSWMDLDRLFFKDKMM